MICPVFQYFLFLRLSVRIFSRKLIDINHCELFFWQNE
jgi:hypothetical protein